VFSRHGFPARIGLSVGFMRPVDAAFASRMAFHSYHATFRADARSP
jgi:hypothetical protein